MVPRAIWWMIWKKRNSQYWEGLARLLTHIRLLPEPSFSCGSMGCITWIDCEFVGYFGRVCSRKLV